MLGPIKRIEKVLGLAPVFHDVLMANRIVFNRYNCWDVVGHLSNVKQRMLGSLVVEYIYDYTVNVHHEVEFMKAVLKAFDTMKDKTDYDEFVRILHEQNTGSKSIDYYYKPDHE